MNPAFIILVVLATILLWFLLSFVFMPLGSFVYRIVKDAFDVMNKDDEKEEKEKN